MGAIGIGAYALARLGGVAANARDTGLTQRDLLLLPLVDALAMAFYLGGLAGRTVRWGRDRFHINPDGTIRPIGRIPIATSGTGATEHAHSTPRA